MSKPIVLIAEELSPATIEALGPDFEVRHCDGADRAALLPAIADVDAILVRSATQAIVAVLRVLNPRQRQLPRVVHAHDALRLLLGLAQRRQEHAGQDRDDRNPHQQLDQCECARPREALRVRTADGTHLLRIYSMRTR